MDLEKRSPPRWLQRAGVCELCGFSRTTFWRITASDPSFPGARYLTPSVPVWPEDEVVAWREARAVKIAAKRENKAMPTPNRVKQAQARASLSHTGGGNAC